MRDASRSTSPPHNTLICATRVLPTIQPTDSMSGDKSTGAMSIEMREEAAKTANEDYRRVVVTTEQDKRIREAVRTLALSHKIA